MKVIYTAEQRRTAVAEYWKTGSATRTVRKLGYPARRTLYDWARGRAGQRKPTQGTRVKRQRSYYPVSLKERAVKMLSAGTRPAEIAEVLDLTTAQSVYAWATQYRRFGTEGLMTRKEKKARRPSRAALESSLPDDPAELRRVAAELMVEKAYLQAELDLAKKDLSVIPGALTNTQKARIIDSLTAELPLHMLLTVSGLKSSSYHFAHHVLKRPDRYLDLRKKINTIAAAAQYTYGYRRIWKSLQLEGIHVSEKVVRRLMTEEQIIVHYARRKRRYSSYAGEVSPAPDDLVKRDFHATEPNRLWLTDISEFAANDGKVYLSAIVDCFDGLIVAWKTGRHPDLALAQETLREALATLPPTAPGMAVARSASLILHSDRGVHYRTPWWITTTRTSGITRSMSRKGCSPDNAACEGVFGRIKTEMFHHRRWKHAGELEQVLNSYLGFYNNDRIKLSFDGLSIVQHRRLQLAHST